jgi:transcriptional regulator with XRE-family HTH domain
MHPRARLSRRLIALREQHEPPLNQQEAADLIGLSLRQYGRLERGQADATLATIRKIADAYSVQPQLLTGTDGDRLIATGQAPSAADFARLEAKINLILDRLDALPADPGGRAVPELGDLLHDARESRPTRRTRRRRAETTHR